VWPFGVQSMGGLRGKTLRAMPGHLYASLTLLYLGCIRCSRVPSHCHSLSLPHISLWAGAARRRWKTMGQHHGGIAPGGHTITATARIMAYGTLLPREASGPEHRHIINGRIPFLGRLNEHYRSFVHAEWRASLAGTTTLKQQKLRRRVNMPLAFIGGKSGRSKNAGKTRDTNYRLLYLIGSSDSAFRSSGSHAVQLGDIYK